MSDDVGVARLGSRWCWPPAPAASASTSPRSLAALLARRPRGAGRAGRPPPTSCSASPRSAPRSSPVEIPASPRRAGRGRDPAAAPRPGRAAARRGARARPARRPRRRGSPARGAAARRHPAQPGARRRACAARPSALVERIVARRRSSCSAPRPTWPPGPALGARDARLGAVAAPPLAAAERTPGAVRAELRLPPRAPLMLAVGRLHPQKRLRRAGRRASARWREPRPGAGGGDRRRAAPLHAAGRAGVRAARPGSTCSAAAPTCPTCWPRADLAVVTSDWEARQLFAQEALRGRACRWSPPPSAGCPACSATPRC